MKAERKHRVGLKSQKTYIEDEEVKKRVLLSMRGPKQPETAGQLTTHRGEKGCWRFQQLHSFMTGYSCWVRTFQPIK